MSHKYLVDTDDPRKDVDDFIDSRAELAEHEFEDARRDGLTVNQAQERDIATFAKWLKNHIIRRFLRRWRRELEFFI